MSEHLTHEQARLACEGFLWGTKVPMRHSMFQIEECIENEDKALIYTKSTTINLSKGGDNFFLAHIEDKDRYERLVDNYSPFIHRTVSKVREVG